MDIVKPEELGFSSSRLARIKPFLECAVERKQYAGFVSLAARRGKVVHLEKCGWMDPKEEVIGLLMLQFMPGFLYPIDQDFSNLVYQALVD